MSERQRAEQSSTDHASAVLRRSEQTRFLSASDDEVGGLQRRDPRGASVQRAEQSSMAKLRSCQPASSDCHRLCPRSSRRA
jgi:hypothetical protein